MIFAVQGAGKIKQGQAGGSNSSDPFSKRKGGREAAGKVHTLLSQGILSGSTRKGNEYFGGDSTVFEADVDEDEEEESGKTSRKGLSFSSRQLEGDRDGQLQGGEEDNEDDTDDEDE